MDAFLAVRWAGPDGQVIGGRHDPCLDKVGIHREVHRVLEPGGRMRVADIRMGRLKAPCAVSDLWTGRIAGALSSAGWQMIHAGVGLDDVVFGPPVDTFAGASGVGKACQSGTWGPPHPGAQARRRAASRRAAGRRRKAPAS
jgi:hypothetical protein